MRQVFTVVVSLQADKKEVRLGGESDRSHSQSRSSSNSDKTGKVGHGHYRRVGVVSMPPDHDTPPDLSLIHI